MTTEQIRIEDLTPARDLGITSSAWLISDTHIGHRNIAGYCGRPSYAEEQMIGAWHEMVGMHDQIIHLGDLALARSVALRMRLSGLPGTKFLLRGNHDTEPDAYYQDLGFTLILPFSLTLLGWTACFTHAPQPALISLPKHLNVHGHIHEQLMPSLFYVNCAVEWTDYKPVRIEELLVKRIARLTSARSPERAVPLSYAEWLASTYGGGVLRSDVERFPDSDERDRVRETYTNYRIALAEEQP